MMEYTELDNLCFNSFILPFIFLIILFHSFLVLKFRPQCLALTLTFKNSSKWNKTQRWTNKKFHEKQYISITCLKGIKSELINLIFTYLYKKNQKFYTLLKILILPIQKCIIVRIFSLFPIHILVSVSFIGHQSIISFIMIQLFIVIYI